MAREYIVTTPAKADALGFPVTYPRSNSPSGAQAVVSSWPDAFTASERTAILAAGITIGDAATARRAKAQWAVDYFKANPTANPVPKRQGETDASHETRMKAAFGA